MESGTCRRACGGLVCPTKVMPSKDLQKVQNLLVSSCHHQKLYKQQVTAFCSMLSCEQAKDRVLRLATSAT